MKVIGISSWLDKENNTEQVSQNSALVDNFSMSDIIPVMLPVTNSDVGEYFKLIDGLVLSGGSDVSPFLYGKEAHKNHRGFNTKRDEFEIRLLKYAIEHEIPTLCICRGLHLLNVVMGGTLYQDLPDQFASDIVHESPLNSPILHTINNNKDTFMYELFGEKSIVNSFHHQGIRKLGDKLKIVSTSNDGLIEAVSIEKEDIYGIQWHPEFIDHNDDNIKIFKFFIDVVKYH